MLLMDRFKFFLLLNMIIRLKKSYNKNILVVKIVQIMEENVI